jgi:hypothetical protein
VCSPMNQYNPIAFPQMFTSGMCSYKVISVMFIGILQSNLILTWGTVKIVFGYSRCSLYVRLLCSLRSYKIVSYSSPHAPRLPNTLLTDLRVLWRICNFMATFDFNLSLLLNLNCFPILQMFSLFLLPWLRGKTLSPHQFLHPLPKLESHLNVLCCPQGLAMWRLQARGISRDSLGDNENTTTLTENMLIYR